MKLVHRRAHGIVWPLLWIALIFGFSAAILLLPAKLASAEPVRPATSTVSGAIPRTDPGPNP